MAKHLLIFSTICCTSLMLFGGANGTGNMHAEENHNYSTATQASEWDVNVEQAEQQPIALPVIAEEEELERHNNLNLNSGSLKKLNIVKRAPIGFTGMRGKKEYESSDFSSNTMDWNINPINHGNTGNDLTDDFGINNGQRLKKAPTAFYGVRGKKYTGGGNDLNEFLFKLEEERLREALLQDFLDRLTAATINENEITKRAPTGFTGLRGKRPANELYEADDDMEKRGPANSFVGLRGKKDVSHQNYKRSATDPFNTRGRNHRFVDFTNKFVAVRGKKSWTTEGGGDYMSAEHSSETQEIPNFRQQRFLVNMLPSLLYGSNGKRTPSGFLGMRGKRAAVADVDTEADAAANNMRSMEQ